MFGRLLFLLTVVPFIEFYFLIEMSRSFGFFNTVLIVIFTGVLGASLLRQQGHSILMDIQRQGSQGQLPSDAIAKGFCTFLGGLLLLTPGVLTDALGLSLIFPVTQQLWRGFFMGQWAKGVQQGNIHVFTQSNPYGQPRPRPHSEHRHVDSNVIDIQARSSTTQVKKDDD